MDTCTASTTAQNVTRVKVIHVSQDTFYKQVPLEVNCFSDQHTVCLKFVLFNVQLCSLCIMGLSFEL